VHPQSSVEFVAGEKIVLSEGFKAYTGCYFNARIDAGGQYREPVETTVLKSDSTTISKIENSEISFSVFPNPSSNVITLRIDADNSLNASINIYNNEGKNVFMVFNNQRIYKTSNIILDISFLHPGIYYCELIAGEYKKSIKLIKT
jgi:hypothetical protein